jgi:hypothetical protein
MMQGPCVPVGRQRLKKGYSTYTRVFHQRRRISFIEYSYHLDIQVVHVSWTIVVLLYVLLKGDIIFPCSIYS